MTVSGLIHLGCAGWWLKRFDVSEEELPTYLAKLADEPKLKPEHLLAPTSRRRTVRVGARL